MEVTNTLGYYDETIKAVKVLWYRLLHLVILKTVYELLNPKNLPDLIFIIGKGSVSWDSLGRSTVPCFCLVPGK